MAFWMDGVPGIAVMVNVNEPSAMAGASSRLGMSAERNSERPMG